MEANSKVHFNNGGKPADSRRHRMSGFSNSIITDIFGGKEYDVFLTNNNCAISY